MNKTNIIVLLFYITGFNFYAKAQTNLVPNPSFEDTLYCPTGGDQVTFATGWKNYSNQSPDYFNSCSTNTDVAVPGNWGGYQLASSGSAYCGISTFYPVNPNKREIIGRNLLQNMLIGTKYYFSMKVSLSINSYISSSYASNKLGVRFSTVPYSTSNPTPINNFAHIWSNSIITDTLNWTTIFGSFIADSAYSHIALGNFFVDLNTDTVKFVSGTPSYIFAYYYIDDICVSTDSSFTLNYTYTGIEESEIESTFIIYPNPVENTLYLINKSNHSFDLKIFDILGQSLFEQKDVREKSININTTAFSSGFLFINIQTKNRSLNYKLLKP